MIDNWMQANKRINTVATKLHKNYKKCLTSEKFTYLCYFMTETTKQDIVNAAIILFNENMSIPLEKVADKAGVTRRTLHRYFKDRGELMNSCSEEMHLTFRKAIVMAKECSTDPQEQLREMLYAGIDCGVKIAFLSKLHNHHEHKHTQRKKDCAQYDEAIDKIQSVVKVLQQCNIISRFITADWVVAFFFSVVAITANPCVGNGLSQADLKKFAWYSFSKGVGI
jgi:AcrR family transcriptional regulator